MKNNNTNRGFITTIIIIIIALVALKYTFHFDIIEYLKSPQAQNVIQYVTSLLKGFISWVKSFFGSK